MGLLSSIGKVVSKVAPIVGAATGNPLLGTAISAGASFLGGQQQNQAAASSSKAANDFIREQMKNRHQWEVSDLRKAGLNPILSAGAAPSMGGASTANVPSNPMGEAVSTALQMKRLNADIANINAQTDATRQNTVKLASDTALNQALEYSATKDALLKANSARAAAANAKVIEAEIPRAEAQAQFDKKYGSAQIRYHSIMDALNRLNPFVSSASEAKRAFSPQKFR